MIATNLWRDPYRSAPCASERAAARMPSLDLESSSPDGKLLTLLGAPRDLMTLEAEARAKLKRDSDDALARLTPLRRDIRVARFIDSESGVEKALRAD